MAGETVRVTAGKAAGTSIPLDGEFEIGRNATGEGALGGDSELSRQHARITRAASGDLLIQDLGSTNGTFVNGQRIAAPTPIRAGDRIEVGATTLEVAVDAADTAVRSTPPVDVGQPTSVTPRPPTPQEPVAPAPPVATAPPAGQPPTPAAPKAPAGPSPFARRPGAAPPAAVKKGGGPSPLAIILLVIGLAIGAGVGALIWAGGSEDGARTEPFFAMAQGFSQDKLNEETGQLEINIEARTFNTPFNIRSLNVNKFLDNTTQPPQRVYDATYTFTTLGRDTLVLEASGEATGPEGPDEFFFQTHEAWRVIDGTGVFEGVKGEGQLDTALTIQREDGANLVKYFTGTLEFPD
jgi:pSer/pThr/pTyr-binding forkhead associated (FHA) protein